MTDAAAAAETLPPPVVRVLLDGVVDYAGLFPPAGLTMAAAVEEFARQRKGARAWMLGRFVLPAGRLAEFEEVAAPHLPRASADWWPLSALVASDIAEDLDRIETFNARHRDAREGAALVDTVELKTNTVNEIAHAAGVLQRQFDTYMEVPVIDDPDELVAAISTARAKAKIRTGGTSPDAFPAPQQVLRFISRCLARGVAFKATAGLHHPWRAEYPLSYATDAERGLMYGFLNVLLATATLHAGMGEREALTVLEERDPGATAFEPDAVRIRAVRIPIDAIRRARESLNSFGSCSFAEPVADLAAQGVL